MTMNMEAKFSFRNIFAPRVVHSFINFRHSPVQSVAVKNIATGRVERDNENKSAVRCVPLHRKTLIRGPSKKVSQRPGMASPSNKQKNR